MKNNLLTFGNKSGTYRSLFKTYQKYLVPQAFKFSDQEETSGKIAKEALEEIRKKKWKPLLEGEAEEKEYPYHRRTLELMEIIHPKAMSHLKREDHLFSSINKKSDDDFNPTPNKKRKFKNQEPQVKSKNQEPQVKSKVIPDICFIKEEGCFSFEKCTSPPIEVEWDFKKTGTMKGFTQGLTWFSHAVSTKPNEDAYQFRYCVTDSLDWEFYEISVEIIDNLEEYPGGLKVQIFKSSCSLLRLNNSPNQLIQSNQQLVTEQQGEPSISQDNVEKDINKCLLMIVDFFFGSNNWLKASGEKKDDINSDSGFLEFCHSELGFLKLRIIKILHYKKYKISSVCGPNNEVWCAKENFFLEDPKFREQLENENVILKYLHEKNIGGIPKVIFYGETKFGRSQCLITDYVGKPLSSFLPLSEDEALSVIMKIKAILDEVHSCGILFNDLHPGNIIVESNDKNPMTIRLIDFGGATFKEKNPKWICATRNFSSINRMKGYPPSTSDDYEPLFYLYHYFIFQSLPWEKENLSEYEVIQRKQQMLKKMKSSTFYQKAKELSIDFQKVVDL